MVTIVVALTLSEFLVSSAGETFININWNIFHYVFGYDFLCYVTRPDPEQNLRGGAKFTGGCTFSTHKIVILQ